jgi:glycosyltransferase involved in cell wall biosynthesis
MKILIGMPAYNEEKKIGNLVLSLKNKGYDVLVCDDASLDNTAKISKENGAMVIVHKKNLGYGGALKTLLTKARELKPDVFVTFDADGQHDFNDIESLVIPIFEKKYDIVIGSRFLNKKSEIPKYRELGIKSITKLTNITHNIDVTDSQSGFRAYGKKSLEFIYPSEEGMGISTEILIKASQNNLIIGEIPIVISYEGDTSTHNPASHGLSVVGTTLKFLSIKHPLIFYGIPGLIFLIIGLIFTVWTLTNFTESGLIVTNLALISMGSIVLGVLLLLTGILLFSLISVIREKN